MSNPIVISYLASDTALYAAVQNVALGIPLVLKGSSPYVPLSTGPLSLTNHERPVSISSTDDNHLAVFTVSGYALGTYGDPSKLITDTVTGVNNNTVQTTKMFQVITSIVPNAIVTNVSAGSGTGAIFGWQLMNTFCPFGQYSVQAVVGGTGTTTYSAFITLDNVQVPPTFIIPYPATAGSYPRPFTLATAFTAATTSQLLQVSGSVTGIQLYVDPAATDVLASMDLTILQQGPR